MAGESTSFLSKLLGKLPDLGSMTLGSKTFVGLSIGSSSVKLAEIKKTGKTWKLIRFGSVQLPEDVIVNREIVNAVAVTDAIKSLIVQVKPKTKIVCSSLSGNSMIIKRMLVEVQNEKELQDAVFWEAEQYLPFDVSEVVMDFHILSRSKDNKTDVLLVAVKKAILDSYMTCIENAGLKPKIIDSDFFAVQNVFEESYPANSAEAIAIVDIGASAIKINIVHAGVPVFTKDSSLGGKNLTSEIQKHLNLSFGDAEALKIGGGEGATIPQEVSDLMNTAARDFSTEIKRAVDFYNASSAGAPVSHILITGGSSKIPNLSKIAEEMSGLPTQLLNPFNAITYDPSVFTPDKLSAIIAVATLPLGLALRAGERK